MQYRYWFLMMCLIWYFTGALIAAYSPPFIVVVVGGGPTAILTQSRGKHQMFAPKCIDWKSVWLEWCSTLLWGWNIMGFTHRNLSEQIFGSSRRHTMAHIRTIPHLTALLRNLHMLNLLRLPIFLNALPNTTSILEMKYIMQIYFLNKYFSSRGDSLSTLRHHIQISSYFFWFLALIPCLFRWIKIISELAPHPWNFHGIFP